MSDFVMLGNFTESTPVTGIYLHPWEMNVTLVDIFKRVLYPVDLFKVSVDSSAIYTLVRLCSSKIIRDIEFLARDYFPLPNNLYDYLMTLAILNDCNRSIAVLMSSWPSVELSVAELIPDVLDNWNNLTEDESKLNYLSTATRKFTRCLVTFLNYMKSDSKSPLRVLDLRGLPMGDRVMNYLSREIISLPSDELRFFNYHILFDGEICTVDTFKKLMYCLESKTVHLHCNKLDLSHMTEVNSLKLLKHIEPKHLVGLCIRLNLPGSDFSELVLKRFTKLTALEITACRNFNRNVQLKPLSLQSAPNLQRLAFYSRGYYFSDVDIVPTIEQLEYLELRDFYPSREKQNVVYLQSLSLRLYEISLNGHLIGNMSSHHWIKLFTSLIPTLKNLELEDTVLTEEELPLLLNCILPLLNLRYLNIGHNPIRMKTLCQIAPMLCSMPKLEFILLPYIDESVKLVISEPDNISSEYRLKIVRDIFATKKSSTVKIVWVLYLDDCI